MSRGVSVFIRLGVLCVMFSACRHIPQAVPDPALLGCYRLHTNLPSSYADSLGYHLPEVIQLATNEYNQWLVYPVDIGARPGWTVYDGLSSTFDQRMRMAESGSPVMDPQRFEQYDRIPGDSIDIQFPSPLGSLVFRLATQGDSLRGRAEWVVTRHEYFLNEGVTVLARRESCSSLPRALVRAR